MFFLLILLLVAITNSSSNSWGQLGQNIDGEAAGDRSGRSVSMSSDGQIVAIGAHFNDGNGDDSGHTRVYRFNGTAWSQLGQDIDGEAEGDKFGNSVSLSADGETIAIGAPENDGNGDDSGHTRVYRFDGTTWSQLGQDIDGQAGGDHSGTSVSLSSDGKIVAIGAPYNDGNGQLAGHFRVYRFGGTTWSQLGQDIDGEAAGDQSGTSVSLSSDGMIVAIGAPYADGYDNNAGHVRVYRFDGTTWSQLGQDIDGEGWWDNSGRVVSLSSNGRIVAIGAISNDGNGDFGDNKGHVRVYIFGGTTWSQLGQDIDGEADGDYSGRSVSLSSNGMTVAIGARNNDDNGQDSGHARVYRFGGTTWSQLGQDLDGEAAGDLFGQSVSLSSDGETVTIGATFNDEQTGHVSVYKLQTTDESGIDNDTIWIIVIGVVTPTISAMVIYYFSKKS